MRSGLWIAVLAACNGGDDDGGSDPASLVVATYNAGLAVGFVAGSESRTPLVADAVAGLDADVVCLEEVWLPEQIAAVEAAAGGAFPHRYVPAAQQSSDAACAAGELDSLLGCVEGACDFSCADDVPDCLFDSCPLQFIGLSDACMRCAMANVGEDPATVASTCEGSPVEFAYGGSFGTMLLSKHPLSAVDEHVFSSTSNRRSVLTTEVDAPGGPITVMCTHLTAVFDTIPYPRDAGTWGDEQLVQIGELNALADGIDGPLVLLGDLNTGPGLDGIQAEAPAGYGALTDAGWDVPYIDLDGRCTFCGDNVLIGEPGDDRIIDHVMTRNGVEGTAATRLFDQTVSADSCAIDLSTSAISDHYGVSVTVTY